jgi:transcriptional regulator with XRE-family HTH domain
MLANLDVTVPTPAGRFSSNHTAAVHPGSLLRDHRRKMGLTIKDVATRSGINVSLMGKFERMKGGSSPKIAAKLASFYNLSADDHQILDEAGVAWSKKNQRTAHTHKYVSSESTTIGEYLQFLRISRGIRFSDFPEAFGASWSTAMRIFANKREPRPAFLRSFMTLINATPEEKSRIWMLTGRQIIARNKKEEDSLPALPASSGQGRAPGEKHILATIDILYKTSLTCSRCHKVTNHIGDRRGQVARCGHCAAAFFISLDSPTRDENEI